MANSDKRKWMAESDAMTLASYQEIMNDKPRMKRAIKMAESKAKDLTKRAGYMQNAAKSAGKNYAKGGRLSTRRGK